MTPRDPEEAAAHWAYRTAYYIWQRRTTPYFVYRQFDADNRLLYIGCTANAHQREVKHANQSPWGHQIARTEYEMHPNYWVATAHESHYIATEGSLYNALGSPDREAAMERRRALVAQS